MGVSWYYQYHDSITTSVTVAHGTVSHPLVRRTTEDHRGQQLDSRGLFSGFVAQVQSPASCSVGGIQVAGGFIRLKNLT